MKILNTVFCKVSALFYIPLTHVSIVAYKTLNLNKATCVLRSVNPRLQLLNCILKPFGSKSLISVQEALCFIMGSCYRRLQRKWSVWGGSRYYGVLNGIMMSISHHLLQSVSLAVEGSFKFLPVQNFKSSTILLPRYFLTRQIKKLDWTVHFHHSL